MALSDSIDRLKSQLLTSGLSQKNQALFQVINQLIGINSDLAAQVEALTGGGSGGGTVSTSQSILTLQDEQGTLPNSRKLNVQSGATMMTNGKQTFIGSSPIPQSGDSEGEEGPMGPPGLQGPIGPTGPPGSGSAMPYWFGDNGDEFDEMIPLLSLRNANQIPETGIIDGTILARLAANETITGSWTFNGATGFNATVSLTGLLAQAFATPQYIITDTTGGLDEKIWRWVWTAGDMYLQTVNDAFALFNTFLYFTRAGNVTESFNVFIRGSPRIVANTTSFITNAGVIINGQTSIALNADQTAWNPAGLGTNFYFSTTPNAARIIRGISAQAPGTIIVIYNHESGGGNIDLTQEDGAAAAGNRITLPTGMAVYSIIPRATIMLYYDGINSRWKPLSI